MLILEIFYYTLGLAFLGFFSQIVAINLHAHRIWVDSRLEWTVVREYTRRAQVYRRNLELYCIDFKS